MVMLSNFGRADGGRETWAYQFIPRLLAAFPGLHLAVHGLRIDGEPDNEGELRAAIAKRDQARLTIDFVAAKRNRVPNAAYFWTGLRKAGTRRRQPEPHPAFVIAVGSVVELVAAMISRPFRKSAKILWLRSIFLDEKAQRIPRLARPLLKQLETAVLRRADLLIANGQDTADYYRSLGLDVVVINNAVELERWHMAPAALNPPLDIAFIGRLLKVKGIDDFIAIARLAAQQNGPGKRFNFHIVGEGRERASAVAADAAGLLRYHGPLANAEVPKFIEKMDVCVALCFTSTESGAIGGAGVSNALLEQMAAGRVMICWDNRAYRQVLDDDSGYLIPQGDVPALMRCIDEIAANPGSARAKATKGQALAAAYGFAEHMDRFVTFAGRWIG